MSFETILSSVSIFVTLLLGLLVFFNAVRSNRTAEKKLTVEEQQAQDDREDVIAKRRREELDRLYARCDELEADVEQLKKDRKADKIKIEVLQSRTDLADAREVVLYRHIKSLRTHIVKQLPPPPPTLPIEVVRWFEEFELTDPGISGSA